jgi:hypothetical protein
VLTNIDPTKSSTSSCALPVSFAGRALLSAFLEAVCNDPWAITSLTRRPAMKRLATLSAGFILASPTFALAAEHSASYRGIGQLYFSFMAAILIYGVYDAYGKMAMYITAPIILGGLYMMLPPV